MEVALIVLDGWGIGPRDDPDRRNAVDVATTPTVDSYLEAGASGRLTVSGRDVGLPEGQMGNSEVGHLNIGAGRIVYHEYTRINDAIRASPLSTLSDSHGTPAVSGDAPFDRNPALLEAFDAAAEHDGRVHLLGLVSDGGVHSDYRHLFALIELARTANVDAVTHAFTDGRDTGPTTAGGHLADLESVIETHGTGHVASVSGRYYAMDRDENWDRTKRAYDAIVREDADFDAPSPTAAIETAYERGETDEFVAPTTVTGGTAPERGDAIIFFNFRSDRARQLVRMLGDIRPDEWRSRGLDTDPPDIPIVTMTEYDRTFEVPVAHTPPQPQRTLGAALEDAGCTQFRIAESEKYAHVTYFLNGGREIAFDGEIRRIVDSPDVPTYDQQPEMSAPAVTDEAIDVIEPRDPDVMVLNYANPDMVGHTGVFEAAVTAVETVDTHLERLVEAVLAAGGDAIITADHGNADDMGSPEDPHTAHTDNDVPFIYLASDGTDGGARVLETGQLADIAPTMLTVMGLDPPEAMTGQSLLAFPTGQGNP